MSAETITFATPEAEVQTFANVVIVLDGLAADLGHILLSGDLNDAQREYVRVALWKATTLRDLFDAEHERQAALRAITVGKES